MYRYFQLSSQFEQHIRPDNIRQSVRFLIGKYPFYEGIHFDMRKLETLLDKILDDCEEDVEEGNLMEVEDSVLVEAEDGTDDEDEAEYIVKDPVRKNQTEVSKSSLLLPENLETKIKTNTKKRGADSGLILAPGEDQIPRNILKEKHPFVLHFPSLFPDGRGGLHDEERKEKLGLQQWIMQRLVNINPMFAQNKAFLFSAVAYLEQHQLMSRINISFMRGKMNASQDGGQYLQTEDGFAVFDGIAGSPR